MLDMDGGIHFTISQINSHTAIIFQNVLLTQSKHTRTDVFCIVAKYSNKIMLICAFKHTEQQSANWCPWVHKIEWLVMTHLIKNQKLYSGDKRLQRLVIVWMPPGHMVNSTSESTATEVPIQKAKWVYPVHQEMQSLTIVGTKQFELGFAHVRENSSRCVTGVDLSQVSLLKQLVFGFATLLASIIYNTRCLYKSNNTKEWTQLRIHSSGTVQYL